MTPRLSKDKKRALHSQPVNPFLAVGFLVLFAAVVGIYLAANFKYSIVPANVAAPGNGAGATISSPQAEESKPTTKMIPFGSSDDFKSYLDDGKRAYGDGIFEAQNAVLANLSSQAAADALKKPAAKTALKNQKTTADEPIASETAQKLFSLGRAHLFQDADIFNFKGSYLFFSPENQFYGQDEGGGETKILDISQMDSIAQTSFIPRDGELVAAGDVLAAVSGNSIFAYDISNANVPRDIWQARISENTAMIAFKTVGKKSYLALKTKIDAANPCPAKPLVIGEKPVFVDCQSIYHPEEMIAADSFFSVFEVDMASGAVGKNLSFVGRADGSTVLIGENGIYAVWGQDGDYVSFFTDFLREKCKSLLPNYLMEKAAALPQYDIALTSKELELRALLSNWIASLGPDEQARIAGEINNRIKDYLRDHYRDYEKTGIAAADIQSFKFTDQNQVPGRILGAAMIDARGGNLRIITNSGRGAAQKMAWLVTGKIELQDPQAVLNNVYVLGGKLEVLGSLESIDLPAGICAAQFGADRVYVSTCRLQDNLYAVGLGLPLGIESRGKLPISSFSYLSPLDNGRILGFSKNNRKIRIALIDAALPSRAAEISGYDLNDYFVDMDANYAAFSIDAQKKTFFLPAARGGYVFSLESGQAVLKKNISGITASRSFFDQGSLYLLGDDGIDVFGGTDWVKTKSIRF